MQGRKRGNRQPRPHNLSAIGTPYWQASEAALYQGDVLELAAAVPPETVDAVITDPPYCSGGTTSAERARDPVSKYCQDGDSRGRPTFAGDTRDARSFKYWCTLWLTLCRRAAREAGYCLVFTDWRQLPAMTDAVQAAGWTWRGVVPWNKGRGARAPHKGYFRHQCEYVVFATNGRCAKAAHGGPWDGCYEVPVRKRDKFHLTGKPSDLMQRLVQVVPPGGLVLDPFCGSATTGVGCLRTGRRFVGFELTAEYCEIAARRLHDTAAPRAA